MKVLAMSLGLAYAAGLNLYAAIAVLGLAGRLEIIGPLPASVAWVMSTWVIALAIGLFLVEFAATLTPGVASAWETFHSVIRPPAAAVLAASVVWSEDPLVVLAAALLGGVLAVVVHTAQLGMRYAIDSGQNVPTGLGVNIIELLLVAGIVILVWDYPTLTLLIALGVLVAFIAAVRVAVRALRQVFTGHWMPGCGLLQDPRTAGTVTPVPAHADEQD